MEPSWRCRGDQLPVSLVGPVILGFTAPVPSMLAGRRYGIVTAQACCRVARRGQANTHLSGKLR
jgi:hypothetical protein